MLKRIALCALLTMTAESSQANVLYDVFGYSGRIGTQPSVRAKAVIRNFRITRTCKDCLQVRLPPERHHRHRFVRDAGSPRAFMADWKGGEGNEGGIAHLIASHVTARLGAQWVGVALKIAHIESRMRCGAANPSGAVGVFQVIRPQQFGISRRSALTCAGGVRAGVAHMARCVRMGARTPNQMFVCHNSGNPFARRVEKAYHFAMK